MQIPRHQNHLFVWIKDKKLKFVDATEPLANLAGQDSVKKLIGKNDYQLSWKQIANYAQAIDSRIISGKINNYVNVVETIDVYEKKPDGTVLVKKNDILITKAPLTNQRDKIIGIIGSHVDITGYSLVRKNGYIDNEGNLRLGDFFGNSYLTKRELTVFKLVLLGKSSKVIAKILKLSYRTVEGYIDNIKLKLQCKTKGDIIYTAVNHGLSYIVYDNDPFKIKND